MELEGMAGPDEGLPYRGKRWRRTEKGGEAINEVIEAGNPSLSHPSLMTRPELHCLRRGHFVMGVASNGVRQKREHRFLPNLRLSRFSTRFRHDAKESLNEAEYIRVYIYFQSTKSRK